MEISLKLTKKEIGFEQNVPKTNPAYMAKQRRVKLVLSMPMIDLGYRAPLIAARGRHRVIKFNY